MQVAENVAAYEARFADVIRSVQDVLRRRWKVLIAVMAVITAVGVALAFRISPIYTAESRLQIDPTRTPSAKSASEAQAQLASEAIETEVSVVGSLGVTAMVVDRLRLDRDPEFAAPLAKSDLTPAARKNAIVNVVHSHLTVGREKLTYVISIRFSSSDPVKAAKIANTFAAAYLDTKVGNSIGTAERQFAFYQRRLDELAAQARTADDRVAQYKSQYGILGGANTTNQTQMSIVDQQISPVTIQLAQAQAAAANAKSQLAAAEAQQRSGRVDSVSSVLSNPTIVDLRRQQADLTRRIGEMQDRYGPQHPEMVQLQEALNKINSRLREESSRQMSALRAQANSNQSLESSLRSDLSRLQRQQLEGVRASVTVDSLQREADSAHTAYDRMAQLAFDTRQASQNSIAQAKIIDTAEPPENPSWPNRPLIGLLSLLVGLGIGIGVITVQEMLVSGMRTVDDIEKDLGIPLLGAVPEVRGADRPADLLAEKPTSQFAESLRNLRASIIGVRDEDQPRVIALTSALPSEGKTTTSLALARTMALNGMKTIIFDVDVRRAQLRNLLAIKGKFAGTIELLHGEVTLNEAIQESGWDNLDQILVNSPYFTSENLFGNDNIHRILEELSKRYDAVVLDLPPLLGLSDARFLAALADAVVLVVKWDATPKDAVKSAYELLQKDSAKVAGAVFSMIDPSSQSSGAYYYYSKQYSSYYDPS